MAGMGMDDPEDAVLAALTGPAREPGSAQRGEGGWTATTGGHVPARPDSIRLVKERRSGDLAMVAFEYVDVEDREWHGWLGLKRSGDGWGTTGGASGSGRAPTRSSAPWANFGAMYGQDMAMAGGQVYGEGVARVRVTSAAGDAIEDSVDGGVALVMSPGALPRPWTVELFEAGGALLGSHPHPRRPPRS